MPGSRRLRIATLAIGCVLALSTLVFAQNSRWADPYQRALKAIDAKNYQAAVPLLQQAIAADPRSAANKYVEGVFRIDYFPYYYLGVAYLELNDYDNAQASFAKARQGLPRPLVAKLDDYQKRLSTEMAAARPAPGGPPSNAGPAAGSAATTTAVNQPKPPAVNPNFDPAVRAANAALAAKRFADAVTSFDAAKSADASEFGRQNLQAKRDEAARTLATGQQLAEEGRQLLNGSQLSAAKAKLQQADQTAPGQKAVSDALAEIRQREDNYQKLKASAEDDVRANNFPSALGKFTQARSAAPDLFAADKVDARVAFVQQKMNDAKTVPGRIEESKAVQNTGAAAAAKPGAADADKAALRTALVALLQGDSQRCVTVLEGALGGRSQDGGAAALHAYLGVAYATQALSLAAGNGAADRLRDKALAEFRQAIAAERGYRLSDRVVSPKIIALFDQARRG